MEAKASGVLSVVVRWGMRRRNVRVRNSEKGPSQLTRIRDQDPTKQTARMQRVNVSKIQGGGIGKNRDKQNSRIWLRLPEKAGEPRARSL